MRLKFRLGALGCLLWGYSQAQTPCVDGFAGEYPCFGVELYADIPVADLGGGENGNDCWGWTAPSGREYAIYCRSNGTAFVEITDPTNPIYLGNLATQTSNSLWRDAKVFNGYAYIVSEAGGHGMQVFDLMQLETVEDTPAEFEVAAHYSLFGNAHNIAINEESGFAYAVGTNTFSGGLHIVDINDPLNPVIAGDFAQDGYTHDVQVVNYNGPDSNYNGSEIAFAANENTVTIVDCTDKLNCTLLSTIDYEEVGYIHQGWLTEDQRYFIVNDELDEINFGNNTRTYIFDVQELENPLLVGFFESHLPASDHNLYVKNNYCYQANYRAGFRILDITGVAQGELEEVAYFDTNPEGDQPGFNGAWSVYPYFPSGNVIISTFSHLFIVRPDETVVSTPDLASMTTDRWKFYPNPATEAFTIVNSVARDLDQQVIVTNMQGVNFYPELIRSVDRKKATFDVSKLSPGMYVIRITGQEGGEILLKQ